MINNYFKNKNNIVAFAIAIIHWVVTFFTDHSVFEALPGNGIVADFLALPSDGRLHFVLCKIILLVVLLYLWKLVFLLYEGIRAGGFGKSFAVHGSDAVESKKSSAVNAAIILKYSLIYFVPIILVLFFKLPEGFLSNDESLIFAEASGLHTYTWFYYLTTYYYIVTMMLIPSWLGPIMVKVFLQVAVCGYTVFRLRSYYRDERGYAGYLPFFIMPVLAYTTSAHRIPVYYLLYFLFLFMLVMDNLENKKIGWHRLFWLFICISALTQWRTEGIYMLINGILLVILAFDYILTDRKKAAIVILLFFVIEYVMTIPQNGLVANRLSDQADNRMGPFWAYTVTNMYRNGLDLEANASSMEKIWRYLDKGTLEGINNDLGDINYEDTLILYYPGYTGRIETAQDDDYVAYVEGCKELFKNNPIVFLKTRIGAFRYAALPYHISLEGLSVIAIFKCCFSIFKSLSYNLFLPCIFVLLLWIYSIIKRKWLYFFMLSGLIAHWFIVFILAPASYFKYYFPIFMCGWSVVLIVLGIKVIERIKASVAKKKK